MGIEITRKGARAFRFSNAGMKLERSKFCDVADCGIPWACIMVDGPTHTYLCSEHWLKLSPVGRTLGHTGCLTSTPAPEL